MQKRKFFADRSFFRYSRYNIFDMIKKEKVGETVSSREDFLFWRLSHYFIVEKGYRLVQMSEGFEELWLENVANKQAQFVRLLRYDLDWGNWLARDIAHVGTQTESLCQQLGKASLHTLNIYVSQYPPVDDYEAHISESLVVNKGKAYVHTILFETEHYIDSLKQLMVTMGDRLDIKLNHAYDDKDIELLQRSVLTQAVQNQEKEKNLFEAATPFFTYIFLAVQIAIFLIMTVTGGTENTANLIRFGAKYNPLMLQGEWWRFIMPIFIHIGILHLLMNSLSLYYVGTLVEKIYGRIRFALIYLFAGFSGTLASFLFSNSISAGASGAIFGLFGALLYIGTVYRALFFRTMGSNVIMLVIINLVFGFTASGIDNSGHIGGLIGGFLAAAIVHLPKEKRLIVQIVSLFITLLTTVLLLYIGFHPNT